MDKRRRNRCQFCRFQKCLAVGMVKEGGWLAQAQWDRGGPEWGGAGRGPQTFVLVGRRGGHAWALLPPRPLVHLPALWWGRSLQSPLGLGGSRSLDLGVLPSTAVHGLGRESLPWVPSSLAHPCPFLCSCPDRQPEGAAGSAPFKAQAAPGCLPCESPHLPGPGTPGLRAQHFQTGLLQGEAPPTPHSALSCT